MRDKKSSFWFVCVFSMQSFFLCALYMYILIPSIYFLPFIAFLVFAHFTPSLPYLWIEWWWCEIIIYACELVGYESSLIIITHHKAIFVRSCWEIIYFCNMTIDLACDVCSVIRRNRKKYSKITGWKKVSVQFVRYWEQSISNF
jgi:hypothetical protein